MPILALQKRARELGRIRIGQKGAKGQPQKLDRFRLTSPSKHVIEKVAELYGGTVQEWTPAGGAQQWEVITDARRLPIMVPPAARLAVSGVLVRERVHSQVRRGDQLPDRRPV